MKTASEIADEVLKDLYSIPEHWHVRDAYEGWSLTLPYEEVTKLIAAAIEADRAQRENDGTIHAAVIAALWDRSDDGDTAGYDPSPAASGAQWVEDEPDEFWEEFAGPMLDDIERKFR